MSTQLNSYVIYGFSLPWENLSWLENKHGDHKGLLHAALEKHEDSAFNPAKPGAFLVLDDGRDGEHSLFGVCLQATNNYGGFDGVIEAKASAKHKKIFKEKLEQLLKELPDYYNLEERLKGLKPSVYVVTHLR